jgi:hypothetical protein
MSDQLERLTTALADRYTIERELGAGPGGMITVANSTSCRRMGECMQQTSRAC